MQHPRRRALGAIPVLLLTACGGGGGGDDPTTSPPPPATPSVPAPPAPPAPSVPPSPPGDSAYGNLSRASVGVGAALNGAVPFPADNPWNIDISGAEVDPSSDRLIASIGADKGLYRDFGAGLWEGSPIGIPYQVVNGQQAKVAIDYVAYGDESDPGPFPIPLDAPIEGAPGQNGDRHVLVIDKDNHRLYELGRAFVRGDRWQADVGAAFHLDSNQVRPAARNGWTSADAAGLPIFPGLVRYDEAAKGAGGIRHALRFTAARTRRAFVPPATHYASSSTDANLPPMGMRVRLKAGFAIPAAFSPEAKAILTALKTHGMFLADNGSDWYLSGAPDDRWDNDRLRAELASVKGRDLEVVKMTGLVSQL
ncbi:MAG: hypothetical protein EON50_08835 [Acidovorax sp.]|nr:MAG: hypothetical protein EON50_08835 [Acidovorax sp.]